MRRIPAWGVLAALVLVSTVVRSWAGLRVPTPWIAADEMIYAELGRSLWETGRLSILGADTPFYSLVHPVLVGLPLALLDTEPGYDVARVLQALAMSLTAVPVFLWGRRLIGEGWALGAAALTLTLPGLAYSGLLMTETLFLPAMTLAAWAAANVLERPTPRAQALLVGATALAVLTRLQALVLVPAFLLAVALFALFERRRDTSRRLLPAMGALVGLALLWLATVSFGAYGPAGSTSYDFGNAVKFVLYHGGDAVFLVGVLPACALAFLAWAPPADRPARAFVAVALALFLGLVAEVGLFASRYVGRLAERDLLALAPLLFLALGLWATRGLPRTRVGRYAVPLLAAALVLALPLGRLVHKAALPDSFSFVAGWELGAVEAIVWAITGVAALSAAIVDRRAVVVEAVALGLLLVTASVFATRFVEREASGIRASFFGDDPEWVDAAADGGVAYFYDGEPHWNAVWEYVFWNRKLEGAYWLAGTRKVPGPLPQERVQPDAGGVLAADAPPYLLASTAFTFAGAAVQTVEQQGFVQKGLTLWRIEPPLRVSTILTGVQGSGDIYGPARMVAYGCSGGRFELTLVAKGAPVSVDYKAAELGRIDLAAEQVANVALPAAPSDGVCTLDLTPSTTLGSTRFEFVRG